MLEKRIAHPTDRGPGRYYVTPPLTGPWADERLLCHPRILAVVERLGGRDCVLCQVGVDTPLGNGVSEYQTVHRDTGPLFPGAHEVPTFQLAVNFGLCDVTARENNGPTEMHKGSHLWSPERCVIELAATGFYDPC